MMLEQYNRLPVEVAIRTLTMAELVKVFAKTHPAFLAAMVRAKVRVSLSIQQH